MSRREGRGGRMLKIKQFQVNEYGRYAALKFVAGGCVNETNFDSGLSKNLVNAGYWSAG
jgi:hypothetical protein